MITFKKKGELYEEKNEKNFGRDGSILHGSSADSLPVRYIRRSTG